MTVDHDERGWPIRMRGEVRVCARPSPGHYGGNAEEFRIDGYCSCECRDMHEMETELAARTRELEILRSQLASVQSSADDTAAALWKAQAECERMREKAGALDRIAEIIDRREWPRAGHSVACAFGEIVAIRRALSASKAKDATTKGVATRSEGAASSDRTRKEAK